MVSIGDGVTAAGSEGMTSTDPAQSEPAATPGAMPLDGFHKMCEGCPPVMTDKIAHMLVPSHLGEGHLVRLCEDLGDICVHIVSIPLPDEIIKKGKEVVNL